MTGPADAGAAVRLHWTGIRLTIEVTGAGPFTAVCGQQRVPLRGSGPDIVIDIATFAHRRPIPAGRWTVTGAHGPLTVAADTLTGTRRRFDYSPPGGALTIAPVAVDGVLTLDVTHPGEPRRRPTRELLATAALTAWYRLGRLSRLGRLGRLGRQRTSVLFVGAATGNLAAVHDRLRDREPQRVIRHLRAPRGPVAIARLITALARADTVLLDDYLGVLRYLTPAADTRIIQLWHAGVGFKAIGFARLGHPGAPSGPVIAHRRYTWAICGAPALVPVYAEAFGIEDEAVIPTGLPRMDALADPVAVADRRARFLARYPALAGSRIVLLAPTFRGRAEADAHYDPARLDLPALAEAMGPDTVMLIRPHPYVTEAIPIPDQLAHQFIDIRDIRDITDVLPAVDILITDYSSIIYEFALFDRPMLFYAYDLDQYAADRGFHTDFAATAPGRICRTGAELAAALAANDFQIEKVAAFRERNLGTVDGGATDRVIDWLINGDGPLAGIGDGGE